MSVEVGGRMVVLGGNPGEDALEIYHPTTREWTLRNTKLLKFFEGAVLSLLRYDTKYRKAAIIQTL